MTRTGIKVDRMASAWLIRRFIDPEARFKFVPAKGYRPAPGELRFDMFEAEFTHEGELCTFEVLVRRFGLPDPALRAIAEIVHDIDVKDAKYGREEAAGIGQLVAGIAAAHADDEARLARGARPSSTTSTRSTAGRRSTERPAPGKSVMRALVVLGLSSAAILAGAVAAPQDLGPARWDFQADALDAPPAGFSFARTGQGREGRWIVIRDPTAPAGDHVLAQLDPDDTDYRFPVAVADGPAPRDVRVEVRCKPVSGRTDEACGLVFRYRDADDYYVARANALEDNVNLYRVVKGRRQPAPGLERQGRGERVAHPRGGGARRGPAGVLGGASRSSTRGTPRSRTPAGSASGRRPTPSPTSTRSSRRRSGRDRVRP